MAWIPTELDHFPIAREKFGDFPSGAHFGHSFLRLQLVYDSSSAYAVAFMKEQLGRSQMETDLRLGEWDKPLDSGGMWCSHAVPWHKMKRHRFWGIFDSCAFFELKNAMRPIQTLLNFKSIYSMQSARSTLWLFRRTVNHSKSVNISKLYFSESEVQCVHSKQPVVLLFVQGGERLGAGSGTGGWEPMIPMPGGWEEWRIACVHRQQWPEGARDRDHCEKWMDIGFIFPCFFPILVYFV